jgi:hypothetical protein
MFFGMSFVLKKTVVSISNNRKRVKKYEKNDRNGTADW